VGFIAAEAGIKLGSVASDITGKSATAMIDSLIDGERRGAVLADLAIGRMRTAGKLAGLSMALTGRFTEHHALLCRLHRDRIAGLDAAVADLDDQIALALRRLAVAGGDVGRGRSGKQAGGERENPAETHIGTPSAAAPSAPSLALRRMAVTRLWR